MSLVYVHGVGNRSGKAYDLSEKARSDMFRRFLCPTVFRNPDTVMISSPYWGEYAAKPTWDLASVPTTNAEALGTQDNLYELLPYGFVSKPSRADAVLIELARRSMADVVDLLCTVMDSDSLISTLDFLTATVSYCEEKKATHPWGREEDRFPWLNDIPDDTALVEQLCGDVTRWSGDKTGGWESLGGTGNVRNRMAQQVRRLHRAVAARLTRPAADGARRLFGAKVTMLIGDVLAYTAQRGTPKYPGPIPQLIAAAIEGAHASRTADDPVVVIAHSMGGNIVYDLLSHYRTDLEVDVLVTVGSQVGLFEELRLFAASNASDVETRVPVIRPSNIKSWVNVVDCSDILAYRATPIFSGVAEYDYQSGAGWAHTAYLKQPFFHRRLAAHVLEAVS